jgi:DivIVA domain-containing protein
VLEPPQKGLLLAVHPADIHDSAAVRSLFRARPHGGKFRLRWRGYDPQQVDEFLRETAADRQRLQEDLAQLEAFTAGQTEERRRELERLTMLRIQVASCLETSIGALRTATALLAKSPLPLQQEEPSKPAERWDALTARWTEDALRWARAARMSRPRPRMVMASLFLLALIPVTLSYRSTGGKKNQVAKTATPAVATRQPSEEPKTTPAVISTPPAIAQKIEGLVLTVTARRQCWIRTHIDGGQPLERLLKADETIFLRANEEAVLRVGDASALSVLINNQPAKPFGASGQVLTVRITRSNYQSLLAESSVSQPSHS